MVTTQLSVYFFLQAAVIILASRLVGKLAQRIGQPQVVGEMIAGVVLGPSLFGLLAPQLQLGLVFAPEMLLVSLAVLAASFGGKGVACWAAARVAGIGSRGAMAIGSLMNARGLMKLIIVNIGLQAGVIQPALFSMLVLMAILTTLMASPLFELTRRWEPSVAAGELRTS